MKHKKLLTSLIVICLALMVATLPFASACAPEEKSLKIGITTPTTGPAAEKGSPMGTAILTPLNMSILNWAASTAYPLR